MSREARYLCRVAIAYPPGKAQTRLCELEALEDPLAVGRCGQDASHLGHGASEGSLVHDLTATRRNEGVSKGRRVGSAALLCEPKNSMTSPSSIRRASLARAFRCFTPRVG